MNSRTRERLADSISARVAVAGIAVAILSGIVAFAVQNGRLLGMWPVDDQLFGVWVGISGLVGMYVALVALVILATVEFLRYTGY